MERGGYHSFSKRETLNGEYCKKAKQETSIYFILFLITLHFSIFRTMGLGLKVIGHTVTPVTF